MPVTPVTSIIITNLDAAVAQATADAAATWADVDAVVANAVVWNNLVAEAAVETREFARQLAERYNAQKGVSVKLSETSYNSKLARCIRVALASDKLSQKAWDSKVGDYVAKCVTDGRQVKLSGLDDALKASATSTTTAAKSFDPAKVATRISKDLSIAEIDALVSALVAVKSAMTLKVAA